MNAFNDWFCILSYEALQDKYVGIAAEYEKREAKLACRAIADAVTEVGPYVRFIVLDLDSEAEPGVVPVSPPSLTNSSDAVHRKLRSISPHGADFDAAAMTCPSPDGQGARQSSPMRVP